MPTPGWMLPPWVVRGALVVASKDIEVPFGVQPGSLLIAKGEKGRVQTVEEEKVRIYIGPAPHGTAEEWDGLFEPEEPYYFLNQERSTFATSWDRLCPQDSNNLGMADYVRTVQVGGVEFKQIGYFSRDPRLNVEPLPMFGTWAIIAFYLPPASAPIKTKRVKWTRRGTWIDERIADPNSIFQTCELDYEVRQAVEKLPPELEQDPKK